MFDIGFWELFVLAVIGIVVVGPEKLPEVVRHLTAAVRKIRRMFHDVRSDIERELEIDEMRRMIHETDIETHIESLNRSVMSAQSEITQAGKSVLDEIDRLPDAAGSGRPQPARPADDPDTDRKAASLPVPDGIANDLAAERSENRMRESHDAVLDSMQFDGETYRDTGTEPTAVQMEKSVR